LIQWFKLTILNIMKIKDITLFNYILCMIACLISLYDYQKELILISVNHRIYLKVFEDGCEAAAITNIEKIETSLWPNEEEEKICDMKVNRPFLFLLKNSKLPKEHNLILISKIEKLE